MTLKAGRIGLISDTHGLVRPEALAALEGSELIIHAGDIGKAEVLTSLEAIAPVIAIRGNNDRDAWAKKIPDVLNVQINGVAIHVIHNVNELEADPITEGFRAIVSGHSHKPGVVTQDGILFINPGSAGPRRFKLPVTVGKLLLVRDSVRVKIVNLDV
ncbi:MAG TPA: metallophosphoesterase family protein [Candidatus Binatia bacterium]|nr:metallophosphoesterase family protein [Candidatus Binatia bacterium]